MKEWNIGDQVKVIDREAIPADRKAKTANGNPALWTGPKSRLAGMIGEVTDKLFIGDDLEELPKPKIESGLRFTVEIHEDVVVARLMDGDVQLGIGHGHVFHEGAMGIMQAGSYAMKKCYMSMGGTFPKKGGMQNG